MVFFHCFFFIKIADFAALRVSVVLHKLARMSSFASCWRCGNVTPLSKSVSPSSIPSEYSPLSINPVLSVFLSAFQLSVLMHMLKLMIFFPVYNLVFVRVWALVMPF